MTNGGVQEQRDAMVTPSVFSARVRRSPRKSRGRLMSVPRLLRGLFSVHSWESRPAMFFLGLLWVGSAPAHGELVPRTHLTPRSFVTPTTQMDWEQRSREIREQILVSAGLWPMPPRLPGRVHRWDRQLYESYAVEKVLLETWPGFYLGGNLYLPTGQGAGPFPAVLNPHGHWEQGRLTDTVEASIPARCINFALRGCIAFAYDMVGYGDTYFLPGRTETNANHSFYQRHRRFPNSPRLQLWSVSLLGLQLWNSIRAVDFLCSLSEVDVRRIGVTGASGGGTQTFLLGAVDDRPQVFAPVCMVSHTMQGGCACENAPGLRIRFSNLDFAAAAAPRPQILVGATGDWTRTTLEIEGPALESVYRTLNVPERIRYVCFPAGHNYNLDSRQAVYAWFERWLLGKPDRMQSPERPYNAPRPERLLAEHDPKRPRPLMTAEGFIHSWIMQRQKQLEQLRPRTLKDWDPFRRIARPLWYHTLSLGPAMKPPRISFSPIRSTETVRTVRFQISDDEESLSVAGFLWTPRSGVGSTSQSRWMILRVRQLENDLTKDTGLAPADENLAQHGHSVLTITRFTPVPTPHGEEHFLTYNRTFLQSRVRDLVQVLTSVAMLHPEASTPRRRLLWGSGAAGLWALLAAPAADATIADLEHWDLTDENLLTKPDYFCPGFLAMGGAITPALLAAPKPLMLVRPAGSFPISLLQQSYKALGQPRALSITDCDPDPTFVFRWLRQSQTR